MTQKILLLAGAGALGALARVALSSVVQRSAGDVPWGTMTVNVLGCFLFGLVWQASEAWGQWTADARLVLLGGFMGSFTTFSTYAFNVATAVQGGRWGIAALDFAVENLVGVAGLVLGLVAGRAL